jgi:hypothetical protein
MITDLKNRIPFYLDDWTHNVLNLKVLASVLFMFFTSIGPAVTFASLLSNQTDKNVGTTEVLMSSAVTGILWSLFSGQPIVILGVTGPVSILTISIYQMSKSWNISFIPFYAWAQIWASIMHVLLAVFNFCDYIHLITRFSCEIFGCLIAIIYLYTGADGIGAAFRGRKSFEGAIFQMFIAFGTCWLGLFLSNARRWVIGNEKFRDLIADYGPTIALVFWSSVPYMSPQAQDVDIMKLQVPETFDTTSGRSWFVNLNDLPVWAVFAAILPGFITTVLFVFDHNVSSLLAQDAEYKLKKPSAFHWDFFILGIGILITGLLGIPPTNGLIPQAPLHTKSLTVTTFRTQPDGTRKEEVIDVYEQRLSNFSQSFLIGLMAFPPFVQVLRQIPDAALNGLFLLMGIASFGGNQLFERLVLLITQPELRSSEHSFLLTVPWKVIIQFTSIQALAVVIIFVITRTPASMVS